MYMVYHIIKRYLVMSLYRDYLQGYQTLYVNTYIGLNQIVFRTYSVLPHKLSFTSFLDFWHPLEETKVLNSTTALIINIPMVPTTMIR